jgi:glycosidase
LLPVALLLLASSAHADGAAPEAVKVEPPGWWANHSINPVRVLIRGRNLKGARVESLGAGLSIGDTRASESGNYLFVDVSISANAAPGRRLLRIATPQGVTEAAFDVSERLGRAGRFRGFNPDDCLYLIMPDRFSDGDLALDNAPGAPGVFSRENPRSYHGGDIKGIIDRLSYLKDLGVTAIWTTPVYDNTSRLKDYEWGKNVTDYHGYGAVDFYRVEEHLGTLDTYRQLVERAHALGLKIIQDQVANHSGPDHPHASDPPTPTWFNGTLKDHRANVFDIKSLTEPNPDRQRFEDTLRGWFGNTLPDFNQDDPEAARYIIQNAIWWLEMTGLDGIRQDTFPFAPRRFWSDWNRALARAFPSINVVGEVFDQRPEVVSFFQGGRARFDGVDSRLNTLFDFPSYFAIRDVFIRNRPVTRLTEVLEADRLYTDPRALVTFLGNHDVPRFMSEAGATHKGLMLAFTYLLTMRGTPQLYYGDEIGMEGREDPDNRRDFPGGFPGDSRDAFTHAGRTAPERKIFDHVKELLGLRARYDSLRRGDMRVLLAKEGALAYVRQSSRERVLVVINNSDRPASLSITLPGTAPEPGRTWRYISPRKKGADVRASGNVIDVSVSPRESIILLEE